MHISFTLGYKSDLLNCTAIQNVFTNTSYGYFHSTLKKRFVLLDYELMQQSFKFDFKYVVTTPFHCY